MRDAEESFLKFSVLMSVYKKEKPEYLKECLDSLVNQTVQANELVLIEDGLLTQDLYDVLDNFEEKYPRLLNRKPLKKMLAWEKL